SHSTTRSTRLTPTSPPEIYPLSLHDALPIYERQAGHLCGMRIIEVVEHGLDVGAIGGVLNVEIGVEHPALEDPAVIDAHNFDYRSEEHTSELQSLTNLVCRLLLEQQNARTHT